MFIPNMFDSIPNSYPIPPAPAASNQSHSPLLWLITLLIVVIAAFFWLCYSLAKCGFLVTLQPGTQVNVHIRNSNGSLISEYSGTLCFSVPFLACVWHGRLGQLRFYCLYWAIITKPISIVPIPQSHAISSVPSPAVPYPFPISPLPNLPHQARVQLPNRHNQLIVLPTLGFPVATTSFGAIRSQFSDDSGDKGAELPYLMPPSPKPSYSYLTMGPVLSD